MKRFSIALSLLALPVSQAIAATDGTLGSMSDGSFTYTVSISQPEDVIRISGLNDIVLDTTVGTIPGSGSSDVCVYMSSPGTYRVEVTASRLSGNQKRLPYSFSFADQSANGPSVSGVVSDGIELFTVRIGSGFTPSSVVDCATGAIPAVFSANISQAPTETGSGTATISFIVEPD